MLGFRFFFSSSTAYQAEKEKYTTQIDHALWLAVCMKSSHSAGARNFDDGYTYVQPTQLRCGLVLI